MEYADAADNLSNELIDSVYNAAGQRTQRQFSVGAVTEITNQWSFDALGRVTEIERFEGASANGVPKLSVSLGFDSLSRLTAIDRYQQDASGVEQLIAQTGYSYDASRPTLS